MIQRLLVLGSCLSIFGFLSPTLAQATHSISVHEAQGDHQLVTLELHLGYGLNLNFRPTAEIVRRVWLDDPSQVTLDFDDPRCAALGESSECAATVIHLRRIHPLTFPNLPSTESTLLTVLSDQHLYQFRLSFPASGSPTYTTLEIQPDLPQMGLIQSDFLDGWTRVQLLEQGLRVAQFNAWITSNDPLWERIQHCLRLLRQGTDITEAAAQAGLSQGLIERLAALGQQTTPYPGAGR